MIEQRQKWSEYTRYLIADTCGSVQIEMYDDVQHWGGTAWIYALWVNEDSRRHGVATALLKRAEDVARGAGHKSVFLEWEEHNTPQGVLVFYLRSGYKPRKESNGYCLLEKKL